MADSLPPITAGALAAVRDRLLRAALRERVPPHEADDIVDRAIWRATRERLRPGSPPFIARVRVALHDEIIEYRRRADARPQIDYAAKIPDQAGQSDVLGRLEFRELVERLRAELHEDELVYALLVSAGWTEADIAARDGWDNLKAGRIRKQVERRRPHLRSILSDLVQFENHKEAS